MEFVKSGFSILFLTSDDSRASKKSHKTTAFPKITVTQQPEKALPCRKLQEIYSQIIAECEEF